MTYSILDGAVISGSLVVQPSGLLPSLSVVSSGIYVTRDPLFIHNTYLTVPPSGLRLKDVDNTNDLVLAAGSSLSVIRSLTFATGDADRVLTIDADTTLNGGTHSGSNTGDVTLTGTPDYITISNQVITRSLIDLTADVTGDLPLANLVPATSGALLLGRASGAGDFEEITLGPNLSISGTILKTAGVDSTGVWSGGVLSANDPFDDKFNVTAGHGYIVNYVTDPPAVTRVDWDAYTNVTGTYVTSGILSYISIDNAGQLIQRPSRWDWTIQRTEIILGVLVHVNLTVINTVNQEVQCGANPASQLTDLFRGLGFVNLNGNVYSANGANMNINKTEGEVLGHGANWQNDYNNPNVLTLSGYAAAPFQYRLLDGTNYTGLSQTDILPDILDDGDGTPATVNNNKYTIQRIYSFLSNAVKIQPGQKEYASLAEAKADINDTGWITEPSIADNGIFRSWLIVKKGTTDLSDTSLAQFIPAGRLGAVGGGGGGGGMQALIDDVTPQLGGPLDINGQAIGDGTRELLTFVEDGSAVNHIQIENQATGGGPFIRSTGDDTNVDLNIETKNAGIVNISAEVDLAANSLTFDLTSNSSSSGSMTVDWGTSNKQSVTLSENITTLTFTAPNGPASLTFKITQDSTPRTITWPGSVKWANGVAPTLSSGSGAIDIVTFFYDGTNYYAGILQAFS